MTEHTLPLASNANNTALSIAKINEPPLFSFYGQGTPIGALGMEQGPLIGKLFIKEGKLHFEGDMDQSARMFADKVIEIFDQIKAP